ncbi:MAG: sulfur oxidation c-type cytochrome SoxA [Burkholderiaceae bacterium]
MAALPLTASADSDDVKKGIEKYREMLQDGNPAELTVYRGEDLWKQARGPKNVSLEQCDMGKGPGVVDGVAAEMPRYFADTDKVMDVEGRIVHCMVTLQGFDEKEVIAKPFSGTGQRQTDLEALSGYISEMSRGVAVNLPQVHPKEKAAYLRGEQAFFYVGGPYDYSCATCHSKDGARIRLQDLPNLTESAPAGDAFTTWPAYRVSQGALRSMQWRMYDCFRQQRFPALKYGSQTSVDLITYLGVKAKGAKMDAPAIKR